MNEKDYIEELEIEIKELENLISIAKEERYSKSIIFILTALSVKKKDKLMKMIN